MTYSCIVGSNQVLLQLSQKWEKFENIEEMMHACNKQLKNGLDIFVVPSQVNATSLDRSKISFIDRVFNFFHAKTEFLTNPQKGEIKNFVSPNFKTDLLVTSKVDNYILNELEILDQNNYKITGINNFYISLEKLVRRKLKKAILKKDCLVAVHFEKNDFNDCIIFYKNGIPKTIDISKNIDKGITKVIDQIEGSGDTIQDYWAICDDKKYVISGFQMDYFVNEWELQPNRYVAIGNLCNIVAQCLQFKRIALSLKLMTIILLSTCMLELGYIGIKKITKDLSNKKLQTLKNDLMTIPGTSPRFDQSYPKLKEIYGIQQQSVHRIVSKVDKIVRSTGTIHVHEVTFNPKLIEMKVTCDFTLSHFYNKLRSVFLNLEVKEIPRIRQLDYIVEQEDYTYFVRVHLK